MDNLDCGVDLHDSRASASRRDYRSIPSTFWANVSEVIETTGFITPYILHPVQGFHTYLPTMGATRFNPEGGVGDLTGKVILITGGWSL